MRPRVRLFEPRGTLNSTQSTTEASEPPPRSKSKEKAHSRKSTSPPPTAPIVTRRTETSSPRTKTLLWKWLPHLQGSRSMLLLEEDRPPAMSAIQTFRFMMKAQWRRTTAGSIELQQNEIINLILLFTTYDNKFIFKKYNISL